MEIKDETRGQKTAIVAFFLGFLVTALLAEAAPVLAASVIISTALGLYLQNR